MTLHPGYAATRISSNLNGSTKQFGWLQAATTKSKPCEMHLTTAVGTCLVTRRVVGGIRGSGLTNICG
jgi:hypothetical protein